MLEIGFVFLNVMWFLKSLLDQNLIMIISNSLMIHILEDVKITRFLLLVLLNKDYYHRNFFNSVYKTVGIIFFYFLRHRPLKNENAWLQRNKKLKRDRLLNNKPNKRNITEFGNDRRRMGS